MNIFISSFSFCQFLKDVFSVDARSKGMNILEVAVSFIYTVIGHILFFHMFYTFSYTIIYPSAVQQNFLH